jgi:lincosamide nucleotidyltransferase A/C/D/E
MVENHMPEMSVNAARALMNHFEEAGIPVWIDGGWAVDALLGRQTRSHSDLDIALEVRHAGAARNVLERLGFSDVIDGDTKPWNFVLAHEDGRSVDFHLFLLDASGNGVYGPAEDNDIYPAQTLSGRGSLDGLPVRCLSPEGLIAFRAEYPHPPRDRDFQDVHTICRHFSLPIPPKYRTDDD